MHPHVKAIRAVIGHIEDAWVQRHRSGDIWAGSNRGTAAASEEIRLVLESAGYECAMKGKSGTEGEFIIDITVKNIDTQTSPRITESPQGEIILKPDEPIIVCPNDVQKLLATAQEQTVALTNDLAGRCSDLASYAASIGGLSTIPPGVQTACAEIEKVLRDAALRITQQMDKNGNKIGFSEVSKAA